MCFYKRKKCKKNGFYLDFYGIKWYTFDEVLYKEKMLKNLSDKLQKIICGEMRKNIMKKPLLSELTLREKIGQMLLGYQHEINRMPEIDNNLVRPLEERNELLRREKFGTLWAQPGRATRGVTVDIAEGLREPVDSQEFGTWIQEESDAYKIPALTAEDFEGAGAGSYFTDLTSTCNPPAIAAANSEELAYELGAAIGRELRCAGVTWRWAPVVDLPSRFSMNIMRGYSDDPEKAIRMAKAHIRGMQSEGVAATLKHFPGCDPYEDRDTHFCPTLVNIPLDEWWEKQGRMFKEVIDDGVYSVMVGHKAFPAVDDEIINGKYVPSTASKKVITGLLKETIGFKGVVITDGIVMGALYSLFPYEELIVRLVNAGNDVILGVKPNTGELIEKAVLDGRIEETRIDDACQRVLDMKEKLGMFEEGYRLVKSKPEIETPKTRKINIEIARRAVTLVRDRKNLLPLDKEKIKNVTIICSAHVDFFYKKLEDYLVPEFEARGAKVHLQRRVSSFPEMEEIAKNSDLIIYAAYIAGHEPMGPMSLHGDECKTYLYAFSSGEEKSIGVSMGYPYIHYDIMENANTFVNTYTYSPELIKAFVEGIYGEIPFVGESPIRLNPTPKN